jgi:hypothetical protein
MKKKLMVLVVVGLVAGLFSVSNAIAAPAWYTCTISQAGATNFGFSYVTLTDTAATPLFSNTVFLISDTIPNAKGMYAGALTAVANSSNVSVYLDGLYATAPVYGLAVIK